MTTSPLLEQIRAEADRLEAAKRRAGIVTLRMIDEALMHLPAAARTCISLHHHRLVCDALNHALEDAAPRPEATAHDARARAAGDT